jgi:hypothetical protein
MAEPYAAAKSKASDKSDWPTVHEEARKKYERGYERERENINNAYEDLKFRRGELEDQWTPEALEARKGRPCLVSNFLPKFIRQVTGDMRQMRPSIKVVPVDSKGDPKTADVNSGLIRYIENRSYAKHVYTTGADSQVACGIGHWRVTTEYASTGTFNQEIRIAGIEDSVSVIWDADSIMPTREDAKCCFVPVDMTRAAFKERWPDAQAADFGERAADAFSGWGSDDYVRVAEYWAKKPFKRTLALFPDGSIDDLTDGIEGIAPEDFEHALEFIQTQKGARIEKRDSFKVCRYLMTCTEILEEEDWPGAHIPIVPVIGEEVRIGREVYRHGVVRYARDQQRRANYFASAEAEVIALQPKAPWIGTRKQFEKHLDLWETANTENHPFLMYDADPLAGGPPQRVMPPVPSQAIQEAQMSAIRDMQDVIGIYDAGLGKRSNETSGVAINARDRQSDTGTFVYIDNFGLAIQRTGQICLDLIPHVYDTKRMIRIIGEDEKPQSVEINNPIIEDGMDRVENDVTSGAYDVMLDIGPGYATKRQEAKESMQAFIQAVPDAAPLIGDLYAKTQDWPQADKVGERLEEMLPPQIKAKLEAERQKNRDPNEEPPLEVAPTPAEQLQMQGAQIELEGKALENEKIKAETAKIMREAMAPAEGSQVDPMAMVNAQHETQMNEIKLAVAADEFETKRQLNAIKLQTELLKLRQAEAGIMIGQEKHAIEMAGKVEGLSQGVEKHEASMVQQQVGLAHGEESHAAKLEQMKAKPERAEA